MLAIAIALIAVLLVVVLSSFIQAQFRVERIMENDELAIYVKALFGLVKFRFRVPMIRYRGLVTGVEVKMETTNVPTLPKRITPKSVMRAFENALELIKHTVNWTKWVKRTLARIHCTKLHWRTDVGFGDAAETAITTGLVWSLKSSILGVIFRWVRLETKPELAVQPSYNLPQFSTNLDCIVKIRLANAMVAGLLLILSVFRAKGGLRTWQNILFKA